MLKKFIETIKVNFSISWIVYLFLGIVAFNFGDSLIALTVISLIANAIVLIVSKKKFDTLYLLTLLLSIIPLLSLSVFAMTSKFNLDPSANFSSIKYVFFMISTLSIPFLGYQSRVNTKFNLKSALKVIYIGLGAWMLINFFITLINYGPFYTFIYQDRYFFEYGHLARFSVDKTAFMLLGFSVEKVSVQLFCLVASVLSSAILGVFFVSFKDDKRSFLEFLVCGSIGLLCLILTLNKSLILVYIALIIGFVLTILFAKKIIKFNKTTKIVVYSLSGLAGLVFIVFMLSALNVQPLAGAIENNNFLNRLFNTNGLINEYHEIIRAMVDNKGQYGFTPYLIGKDSLSLSGSWLFDMFAIAQAFGWIVFVVVVVAIFVRYAHYFKSSNDDTSSKILLLGLILSFLLFTLLGYNSMPFFENKDYLPLFFVSPFVLLMFAYGYMGTNKEETL